MKALVIHGAKDLRLETRDAEAPGPGQVAVALKAGAFVGPTCIITITVGLGRSNCVNQWFWGMKLQVKSLSLAPM